jgi:glucokinase
MEAVSTARRDGGQAIGLVGDFGGSTARFAVACAGAGGLSLTAEQEMAAADHADVVAAARHFIGRQRLGPLAAACFAIAGPVVGDRVELTNGPWRFSVAATRAALGLEQLDVINDFTALALSLPALRGGDLRQLGGGEPVAGEAKAVIGPGTGLGVSGLVWDGRAWIPLKSEGGHATFSPASARELEVARILWRRYDHASCERVLSGGGLVALYDALAELAGRTAEPLTPPDVAARARERSCDLCVEAVTMFCAALGTAAGNLALTLGARGGVYIGGGIAPRLLDQLKQSEFRVRFEAKGRSAEFLRPIPAYVILREHAGLLGAAMALAQRNANRKGD